MPLLEKLGFPPGPLQYGRLMLTLSGVLQPPGIGKIYRAQTIVFCSCIVGYSALGFGKLIDFQGLRKSILGLMSAAASCHVMMKQAVLLIRTRDLTLLLDGTEEVWREAIQAGGWRADLVQKAQKSADQIAKFCGGLFLALIGIPLLRAIVSRQEDLPFDLWMPIDHTKYYFFACLFQYLFIYAGLWSLATPYIVLSAITLQVCAQIDIFYQEMESLRENCSQYTDDAPLKVTFKRHAAIIRLVQLMNSIFNAGLFVELAFSTLQNCLAGYLLAKTSLDDPELGTWVNILVVSCFMPYIICWCGAKLKSQSAKVLEGSYDSGWEGAPPKFRSTLLSLFQVSNRPLTLSLSKHLVMDYELYSRILQTSYSLFTIMRTLD